MPKSKRYSVECVCNVLEFRLQCIWSWNLNYPDATATAAKTAAASYSQLPGLRGFKPAVPQAEARSRNIRSLILYGA